MSLINDALKRANQSQKPKSGDYVGAPMQPVESKPRPSRPWILPVVCVVLFLFSMGLLWQWWGLKKSAKNQTIAANKTSLNTAPKSPATSVDAKPAASIEINTNLQASTPISTKAPVTMARNSNPNPANDTIPVPLKTPAVPAIQSTPNEVSKSGTTAAAPQSNIDNRKAPVQVVEIAKASQEPPAKAAPGPFPELKLQGIFFRLNKPTVLMNGRNLTVGDEIAGARITQIERQSVTVDYYGQKKVLGIQ